MKFSKILLLFSLWVSLLFSCKSDKKMNALPLLGSFYTRYSLENNQLNILGKVTYSDSIALNQNDTTQYLIEFDQISLLFNKDIQGNTNYIATGPIAIKASYPVKFFKKSTLLKEFKNPLVIIDSFSIESGFSKEKGGIIKWIDFEKLKEKDGVVIIVKDASNEIATINIDKSITEKQFQILPEHIQKLKKGPGTIQLIRTSVYTVDDPQFAFENKTECYSKIHTIQL